MFIYSFIMFSFSILLIGLGTAIHKGRTDLIHDYHQTKVSDRKAYGKAFGKALFTVGLAPLISGTVALLGDSKTVAVIAVVTLILFLVLGIAFICSVQRKYNGGIF